MPRVKTSINALETEDIQSRRMNYRTQEKHINDIETKKRESKKPSFKSLGVKTVKIQGLNKSVMKKSAKTLQIMKSIFRGIIPREIITDKDSIERLGKKTEMSTSTSETIMINSNLFSQNSTVIKETRHYGQKYGPAVANSNYSFIHEYGHIVNLKLIKKAYQHSSSENDTVIDDDYKYGTFATALIAECLVGLADTDTKIQNVLKEKLNITSDYSSHLDKIKADLSSKQSELLKALYDNGFTSDYGSSDTGELYAEAFSDYCWYKVKCATARTRYINLTLNPLSKLIVEKSQLLWEEDKEMEAFRVRHEYSTQQLQTTVNTTQQLQTTVKSKQQSLTSKGGLTK